MFWDDRGDQHQKQQAEAQENRIYQKQGLETADNPFAQLPASIPLPITNDVPVRLNTRPACEYVLQNADAIVLLPGRAKAMISAEKQKPKQAAAKPCRISSKVNIKTEYGFSLPQKKQAMQMKMNDR